ncbi:MULTISPECIES: tyrosine-type recombinase/integrase [Paraburkholderia]|uniref:Tyrosine-type recombinase/integrase n=1 Tax=Paraburkholderia madseniana TaxID=2599607 RepID=A0AAP5BIA6_9BURK|nr:MULTISPECIES: tyrosine-type recombinase/integrase [Paraburkholderia]MCX4150035.1 tyrosine-type recombinase/integrase [Paraburkholderia madseniana]MCX4175674.1 tyrosine-type recombinase/integrase [Paraburkholderia madseniana]MDN7152971.1 tyrosine-type recombinase/integrase [Paraburkholderia sp. WS6]MDQ6411853.1 tyrosine-type recombinase/integrase [Paraburkholderia madseniana]MDQ6463669.1 tyrosine-type recombinase/integrase [Paraburkholderia madseniana]
MNDRVPPLPPPDGTRSSVGRVPDTPNRVQSPILPPDLSDEDVVARWLRAKATGRGRLSPTTLEQYRTEAERLFWYARQTGATVSSWTMDEFASYLAFLQAPASWAIRRPGVRRGSSDWRPFLKPLSDRSAGQTQKIVTSLFDWMRDVGYLQLNPATGMPTVGRRQPEKQARFLAPDDTALIREVIAARPELSREARLAKARDLFAVDLFERTGLRTTEAVRCVMGHVRIETVSPELRREFPDAPPFQWLLRVERGKGGKARWVPCDEIALSLQAYRMAYGLPPVPAPDETLPLLLSLRRTRFGNWKGLRSRTTVWNLITGLCAEALVYARAHLRRVDAERFEAASTHWLRHSYAKGLATAVGNGLDARAALENMGHADMRTFNQYVDDEPMKRALATSHARRNAR